jgi:hypothetical protein
MAIKAFVGVYVLSFLKDKQMGGMGDEQRVRNGSRTDLISN